MSQVSIIDIEGNNPQIPTQFDGNVGSAVPVANVLNILGQVVAAGTTPVQTVASGNTVTTQVQRASSSASTDATKVGLAVFNSANFIVDVNGFVSASTTTPLSFPTDSGTGVPSGNALNLRGQSGVYAGSGGIQVTSPGNANVDYRLFSPYTLSDFNFENNTAATKRTLAVQNNSTDASSDAVLRATVVGASSSDPYLQVVRGATMCYCWGIDTSDSNTLKICADANSNSATPSGGTLLYKMTSAGAASYVAGNLDVTRIANGSSVRMTVSNTENTNTASHANLFLSSGGASGGNAYVVTQVSGVSAYAFGMDNTDSDKFKITNSNTFVTAGTTLFTLTNAGALSLINNVDQTASVAGTLQNSIVNSGNGATSAALQLISVGGGSASDPFTTYTVSGATSWSAGIDNSVVGDPYVIAASTALGTSNAVSISTAGVVTLTSPLPLGSGGTNASLTASNGGIFYSTGTAGAILSGTATAGQILRSGASSAPSWSTATYPATAGTSGNILTSNGTNFVSSSPAGLGAALVLISSQTASNSANLTFTSISGYTNHLLIWKSAWADTNNAVLELLCSNDGGASYSTTGYAVGCNYNLYTSTIQSNLSPGTYAPLSGQNQANLSNGGYIYIEGLTTADFATVNGQVSFTDFTLGGIAFGRIGGKLSLTGVNALKLQMSTGNLVTGTYTLYGIRES